MRLSRAFVSLAPVASGVGVLAFVACDTFTRVGGRVVDRVGHPVQGATVTASKGASQHYVLHTDTACRFETGFTGGLRSPDAVVRACRPGFASRTARVPDGAQERDLTLTLLPVGAGAAVSAGGTGELPCP